MMKKIIALVIICFTSAVAKVNAQDSDFVPGWYIVENGCQYSDGTIGLPEGGEKKEILNVGEVVFAYMKSGGVNYCISPSKEEFYIKGTLTKVSAPGKVGFITEAVSLMDTDLSVDDVFWVTNVDPATSQATILLANGQKINIPSKSIMIASKYLNKIMELLSYIPVSQ